MAFRLDTPYYAIPGSQPEGATFGAVMEILLKTRLKLKLDTGAESSDEDVNTYLAGLLVSYMDPSHLAAVAGVLSRYDVDVHQAVAQAQEDRVHIYWIYKVNADDLLISVGVFQRLWTQARPQIGRLRSYYGIASEYQKRIYGKPTAVGQIQAKLSEGPERYLTLLSEASGEYLHFLERLLPQELVEFTRRIEREFPVKAKRDELLDAYSAWVKEPGDLALRGRLVQLAQELQGLDPSFRPDDLLSRLKNPE